MQFDRQDYRQILGGSTGPHGALDISSRVAPPDCLLAAAPVATLMGERDLGSIMPGQMVLTNAGPRVPKVTRLDPRPTRLYCHVPAGTFGPNVPLHDLWLSPDQPIALRLDQSVPARKPVTHRLSDLLAMFGGDSSTDLGLMPQTGPSLHLAFDQAAVVYIAGLPLQIGGTDL